MVRCRFPRSPGGTHVTMTSAQQALDLLRDGNRRFVEGVRGPSSVTVQSRRLELVEDQSPFAIVLGCSDSRVPAEIVFDQGLGDLFVIRVAGNITKPSQIGSVEFAAERFGTRLVVVMGHSNCGVVRATVEVLMQREQIWSPNSGTIIDSIRPSIEALLEIERQWTPEEFLQEAVRANVCQAAEQLRQGSKILQTLIQEDHLMVVGCIYSLETGLVEFFDVDQGLG